VFDARFDPSRYYSAPEVWRRSHAPREYVYTSLKTGQLRAIRRGKRWLIPGSAALEWIGATKDRGGSGP
jgi:hypothetical protein